MKLCVRSNGRGSSSVTWSSSFTTADYLRPLQDHRRTPKAIAGRLRKAPPEVRPRDYGNSSEDPFAFRESLPQRHPLCANTQPVGGVLDVATRINSSLRSEKRGADFETVDGCNGVFSGLHRVLEQFFRLLNYSLSRLPSSVEEGVREPRDYEVFATAGNIG